jgi:putative membrane protein
VLGLVIVAAGGYLLAAVHGSRCDRRRRRWPRKRTACFLGGLTLLVLDVFFVGSESDPRLSAHTFEHMVMRAAVAPLIVASAPVRLVLFGVPSARPWLRKILRSRPLRFLCTPVGSVTQFSLVLIVAHLPAVYELTLRSEYAHELEHALFLTSAILYWAPLLGADPIPHRAGPRGRICAMLACTMAMAALAVWLGMASPSLYAHAASMSDSSAVADHRLAAAIMWLGFMPAIGVEARVLRRRRHVVGA